MNALLERCIGIASVLQVHFDTAVVMHVFCQIFRLCFRASIQCSNDDLL